MPEVIRGDQAASALLCLRERSGSEWDFLTSPEFWTAQAFGLVVGIASGMATGLAVWWYLTRRLRPRFMIHDRVGIAIDPTGGPGRREKYRIKIENLGSRTMRDVDVQAVITYRKPNGNVQLLDVPVRTDPIAAIGRRAGRTVHLKTELISGRDRSHFSAKVRRRLRRGMRVSPADLLNDLGPESRLRVTVSAIDDVTASRTVIVREMAARSVTNEPFTGNGPT